ncbi:TonB-dependent vitamin B12 receptor [Viridibacterium curvum]|uniref:TonB-dependent vitamin B12 receptor n=1 Tax=Viridibacterium curvum TaxID=1101404 RepID=A0ABP9QIU2_9RHOO
MNFHKLSAPALALVSIGFCAPAAAQEDAELPLTVVTPNRVARTVDETLAPVTVITRKDIERQQAQSVLDVLTGMPGVTLANTGGPGKLTSLFLRGTNSDHVLIMIDGVKIGSATAGSAGLQDIPLEQIERIEIVRGPRASLYGSEAIGGVLQIFTRKGVAKPAVSLGGGSRGTYSGSAFAGVGDAAGLWASAGVTGGKTRSFNACGGASGGCFANEPDRDPYSNVSFNLRGGASVGEVVRGEVQYLQYDGSNNYDGGFQNESDTRTQLGSGKIDFTPLDVWRSGLTVAQQHDDNKSYKNGAFTGRFLTRRDSASWLNDFTLAKGHTLVVGLDTMRDEVISTTAYTQKSRRNTGFAGQYLGKIGSASAELALRHDNNEQYGRHNTGSVAFGYAFAKALQVNAAYGTAFKAPTFNQLYFPGFNNPNLQPESARNREIGFKGELGVARWGVQYFDNRIKNLISGSPPNNVLRSRIHGLELTSAAKFGKTNLGASATFQNPKDHSGGANEGNLLVRRPRQMARVDADQDIGDFGVGLTWSARGRSYDNAANTTKLGGYSLWDLRTEYRYDKSLKLQLRIENLFDKRYETAYLYNQAGFGAFVTLRYQMQ